MECSHILVRFGELTTKGKNRKLFIRKLTQNTKEILKEFSHLRYEMSFDRLYIMLNNEDPEAVCQKLQTVFGIHSFSVCYKVESDLEKIKEVCLQKGGFYAYIYVKSKKYDGQKRSKKIRFKKNGV